MIGSTSLRRSVPRIFRGLLLAAALVVAVRADEPNRETAESARARIRELRTEIAGADDAYFKAAAPTMSDAAYDALRRELAECERRWPSEAAAVPPLPAVGDDRADGFAKAAHRAPMLGLAKTYDLAELRDWFTQIAGQLGVASPRMVVEPKIDGVAVSVVYEKGKLVRAITRGNGREGDDITENVRTIRSCPATLRAADAVGAPSVLPELIELRGEIYLPTAEFERLNRERVAACEEPWAHPRNVAAGTIKSHDPRLASARGLAVVFYGWGAWEPAASVPGSQQAFHAQARAWGLPTLERVWTADSAEALGARVEELGRERDVFAAPLDGAVVKLDSVAARAVLGDAEGAPRWAIAYKYAPLRVATVLRRVVVQVGRTGVLTPVAEFDPVAIGGSTVARATLHNRDYATRLGLCTGDRVTLERAGEVIPSIVAVEHGTGGERFAFPLKCPSCGAPVEASGAVARCTNRAACPAQIAGRIEHFCGKNGVAISGVGEALAGALVETGHVRSVDALYRLSVAEWMALPGVGCTTAEALMAELERSKRAELWRFISGLSIPQVGPATAKALARHYRSLPALVAATRENLPPVLGESAGRAVLEFFAAPENRAVVAGLLAAGVSPTPPAADVGRLAGKTFVLTGRLPTLSREAVTLLIESAGGAVSTSVTSETDYVVVGRDAGTKLARARELQVPVIDEAELRRMLEETAGVE
jgi:DNA ligase (NAD+)